MENEANERSFAQPERCCAVSATTVSCALMIERRREERRLKGSPHLHGKATDAIAKTPCSS